MSPDQVRFGFLGAGWIAGRALAPAVHAAPGAQLAAVAARDADRAAALQPSGRVYTDYAALLEDPAVEVVYISLPNDLHRPWTLAALQAGKHVLCEKPLGLTPAEVREMADAAAAAQRLLVEAFWYRWHPRTRRLEQLVAEGALGPLQHCAAEFSFVGHDSERMSGNYRLDPQRGGGARYDVGCYAASAAHLVLGPQLSVIEATATPSDPAPGAAVDLRTEATLAAPDGARARVACSISGPDRQYLEARGAAAVVGFPHPDAFTSWHTGSALTITTPDRAVREEFFAPVDPYQLMVEAIAARVRGQESFLVGLDHSLAVATTLASWRAAAGV